MGKEGGDFCCDACYHSVLLRCLVHVIVSMKRDPLYLVREVTASADIDLCARLRADVYCAERGIIPSDAVHRGRELDEYDSGHCITLLATDEKGIAAGTLRIIFPGGPPLPIERSFGVSLMPTRRSAELSRLAVHREHRGAVRPHLIMLGLCRAAYDVLKNEVDDVYAIVEPRFFSFLQALGYPFVQLGDAKTLNDDPFPTIPTVAITEEIVPSLLERERNGDTLGLRLGSFYARPFDGRLTLEATA
jgi:N-acyl-L-homoserine lactone synthetase